ncbi:hypothetical protein D3C85_278220 [compost metagenome]
MTRVATRPSPTVEQTSSGLLISTPGQVEIYATPIWISGIERQRPDRFSVHENELRSIGQQETAIGGAVHRRLAMLGKPAAEMDPCDPVDGSLQI